MFTRPSAHLKKRVQRLQDHLRDENPLLVDAVESFRRLDKVGYKLGLLSPDQSFATDISWWPMISILGTFSAGKSTFINQYTGVDLQETGNQAVDDRFTVICYSRDEQVRVLPGLSLDADPRFPFYQISEEIEKVATGEGARIDTYLQLKTCPSEALRGKILIDSPGFDADASRTSTLRITDHIINLSDLVLVFFDARHPEPGAMQDTLKHLVSGTVRRNDASKVLFILNQIDNTAREDNVEDVVAAWQRAISQHGLVSGRFYCIYNENAAVEIEDDNLRARYQNKRNADIAAIYERMAEVSVERIYRIIGSLENTANQIEHQVVPRLREALADWRRRVLIWDGLLIGALLVIVLIATIAAGWWQGLSFTPPAWLGPRAISAPVLGILLLIAIAAIHFTVRNKIAKRIAAKLAGWDGPGSLTRAFLNNTRAWLSILRGRPWGWNRWNRRRIARVREGADEFVQKLNDLYANPSGKPVLSEAPGTAQPKAPAEDPHRQQAAG